MKNTKLKETRKKGIYTLITLLVIALSVYLGFTPLYALIPEGVPKAVIGSSFGAIFVIILTMYLLNKQTEIEQESKRGERVFDEKVQLYQSILKTVRGIVEDGFISMTEVKQLPFAMVNLQMVGADDTIKSFAQIVGQINKIYDKNDKDEVKIGEQEEIEIFKSVSDFSIQCRIDLGISDHEISKDLISKVQNVVTETNKISKRDTAKISFKGVSYPKSHLVHAIFKDFLKNNPQTDFEQLTEKFPPIQGNRPLFVKLEEALEIKAKGQARHFVKEGQELQLKDGPIAVSNQWGVGNLPRFLDHCRDTLGIEVG
jgi:hypothetical protein